MTISFSGLASGLDTSSWVESLTALKRAKVETYKAEKEKYVLNKETLTGIRNFFSSFRSMIEKVTDSRFGLGSGIDLFAQTKALTSNANILTATSTSDAREGTYEINISNLATNTEAISGSKTNSTYTVSEIATLDSTLTSLGVKAGNIGVTVGGSEHQIRIGNDDTIQSFITKLDNIGVSASYNENSGIFNLDLNATQIRDIDSTGIVDALHLRNINSAFASSTLKTQLTNTVTQQATGNTKLSELGVRSGNVVVKDNNYSNISTTISISSTTTIDSFVQSLTKAGFSAEFIDGRISLNNAYIYSDDVGLKNALGWNNETVVSSPQTSGSLLYTTTITEATAITRNTKLNDLSTGVEVHDGDTVVVEWDYGLTYTVTLSATSTVGDLIDGIAVNSGLSVDLNDGIITISDGMIRSGTYDIVTALGLTTNSITSSTYSDPLYVVDRNSTVQNDATSTAAVTWTETRTAQVSDLISDYVSEDIIGDTWVNVYSNGSSISEDYETLENFNTFGDLFDWLGKNGIDATLTNGVITLTSAENKYVTGLECFGITTSTENTGASTTVRRTDTLYYTCNTIATENSKISDFVESSPSTWDGTIYNNNEVEIANLQNAGLTADSTFADLKSILSNNGINMSMNNGVITLTSATENYVSGGLFTELGIGVQTSVTVVPETIIRSETATHVTTTTLGAAMESTEAIKQYTVSTTTQKNALDFQSSALVYNSVGTTKTAALTEATTLKEAFGTNQANLVYTITIDGTATVRTISTKKTAGDLVNEIKSLGATNASITYNRINMALGLSTSETSNGPTNVVFNSDVTGSQRGVITTQCGKSVPTTIVNVLATESTTLGELNTAFASGTTSRLILSNKTTGSNKSITLTSDQTIGDVITALDAYGIEATLGADGVMSYSATGDYIISSGIGGATSALGLTGKLGANKSYSTTSVSTTTLTNATSGSMLYQLTSNSAFDSDTISVHNATSGNIETITVSYTMTIDEVVSMLQDKGINASFDEATSKIKIAESNSYIRQMGSDIASMLKLTSGSYTTTKNEYTTTTVTTTTTTDVTKTLHTNTTSNKLENSYRTTASTSTKIGDLDILSTGTMSIQTTSGVVYYTVTADMTIGNVLDFLDYNYGISFSVFPTPGVLEFNPTSADLPSSGSNYILDFGGVFGLDYTGNSSSGVISSTTLHTATMDTTIESLPDNLRKLILINDSTNEKATVTVSGTGTVADLSALLDDYGINLNITDGIATLTADGDWYFNSVSMIRLKRSLNLDITTTVTPVYRTLTTSAADMSKDLGSLFHSNNNSITLPNQITVNVNGTATTVDLVDEDNNPITIQSFVDKMADLGINVTISSIGRMNFSAAAEISIEGLENINIHDNLWNPMASYTSSSLLSETTESSQQEIADRNTKLSDLGITTGGYYLYKDGVQHSLYISEGDTVGDFLDSLSSYGISAEINNGVISTGYNGEAYFDSITGGSNILERLGDSWYDQLPVHAYNYTGTPTLDIESTVLANATLDTCLGELYNENWRSTDGYEDSISVTYGGNSHTIELKFDDSIQDLLNKFKNIGINASFSNGKITLDAGNNELSISSMQDGESGYWLSMMIGFRQSTAMRSATDPDTPVMTEKVVVSSKNTAAANYADLNTKLSLLNITTGNLSIFRNGQKANIIIDEDETFATLGAKISAAFSGDVKLTFNDGHLTIGSDNAEVVVGTASDKSNFLAVTGMTVDANKNSTSARSLYKVNGSSKVMEADLFAGGNVTEGSFIVGNATIEINENTTINDLISQINYSDSSSATAYWDNINGNFVIKSKVTGASLINIEAGSTNFTDVMGFTKDDGGVKKMNIENQTLGQNAHFTINGTSYTSTSNTISSDVSKIDGVTLNLKDITQEGPVTLTIEKDKDSVADAVEDIVESYNALMENIDKEIASSGNLNGETTLKFIRNQIRSLMTSSIANNGSFKNLTQVGISLEAATAGNIRTDNINTLSFDKDKFLQAFEKNSDSLKTLLIGTETQSGILTQVENILDNALASVTGYFASAEKSLNSKITNLNTKIEKTNTAADRYKTRLESKFKAMDMLISKFQNQYSSFLS